MAFNVEELFDSIKVIVTEELNNQSFDSTVICTIVEDANKESGHYIVSDGTIKFDAYTNDSSYEKGDQVRVSVLNGDYSQRKFIVGPYVADTSGAPVVYVSPTGTTVATTQNLLTSNIGTSVNKFNAQSETRLQANGATKNLVLWKTSIAEDSKYYDLQADNIYNIITLSAKFKTAFVDVLSGNYGLRLDLLFTPEKGSNERIQKFITFDSDEMIGNPYSFVIPTPQQTQINIGVTGIVTEMVLSAYQGITIDKHGREISSPFVDLNNKTIGANNTITIQDIELGFASDLTSIDNNTLQIYTNSSLGYVYNDGYGSDEQNLKEIGLLWYNKTDNSEYTGFSDGLADNINFGNGNEPYDEIEYRKISQKNSRLMAQLEKGTVPTDYYGLMLAADIEEAKPLMENVYNELTTTLTSLIKEFGRNLTGSDFLAGLERETSTNPDQAGIISLTKFTSAWRNSSDKAQVALLLDHKNKAKTNVDALAEAYEKILAYAYSKQMSEGSFSWPNTSYTESTLGAYYTDYIKEIEQALIEVEQLLVNIDFHTRPKEWTYHPESIDSRSDYALISDLFKDGDTVFVYPGYRGIYDSFNKRISIEIAIIRSELDKIKHILDVNIDPDNGDAKSHAKALMDYKLDNYVYNIYQEADLSNFNNRYCIYWYQYDNNYVLEYDMEDEENKEYFYGNFAGLHWKRILDVNRDGAENNADRNIGLPVNTFTKQVDGVNKTFYVAKSDDESALSYYMDPKTKEERIKAILFYNHNQIESNVLTFTNLEADLIPPEDLADDSDSLRIEHGHDSFDHYALYNSACSLNDISEGAISRQITCFYDGVFSGDEALAEAGLYWYIPTESTMLSYDKNALIAAGFSTDENEATQYSRDGYVYFYKKVGSVEASEAVLDSNGEPTYDADGSPIMSSYTTSKLEDRYFTYKISQTYDESAKNNTIYVCAHVPSGDKTLIIKGSISFAFSISGTNGTKYTLDISTLNSQSIFNSTDALELKVSLYDSSNNALSIYQNGGTGSEEQYGKNSTYNWIFPKQNAKDYLSISESNDDTADSLIITVNKTAATINSPFSETGGILKVSTELNKSVTTNLTYLSTLYSVPYSINKNYYISGPTIIVYDNAGNVSRLSEKPYNLRQHNIVDENNVIPPDSTVTDPGWTQTWSLDYYEVPSSGNARKLSNESSADRAIIAYLPSLNSDNTLTAPPMFVTDVHSKYYAVAVCRRNDNQTILWAQPIIIIQNNYASATLNNWDGNFVIDEVNGTIMSTMVGAGKKNMDNSFSGVLMGDVQTGAGSDVGNVQTTLNSTKTGLGLYGFHEGQQSFNFNVDGTAFLGKSGRGRLSFDGNNGILYSGSWLASFGDNPASAFLYDPNTGDLSLSPGTAGMALDLQSGHIDAYNFKITSNNIYLNSTPPSGGYYFRIGNNGGTTPIDASHSDNDENNIPRMTKGYMAFTEGGELDIRANALSITGQLGGVNLLRQTSPKRLVPVVTMKRTVTEDNDGNKSYSYNIVPLVIGNEPQYDWDVAQRNTYSNYLDYCIAQGYESISYDNQNDFAADNKRKRYTKSGNSYIESSSWSSSRQYYVLSMTPIDEETWNKLPTLAWSTPNINTLLAGSYENASYSEVNAHVDKKYYLAVTSTQTPKVSQTINGIRAGEYYTVSGYVSSFVNNPQTLTISFYNSSNTLINFKDDTHPDGIEIPQWSQKNTVDFEKYAWTPFEMTFKVPSSVGDSLTIMFTGTANFGLWHTKLESGSIATAWSPSPDDVEDTIQGEQDKYNTYLSQDVIFDKLITDDNGEKMVGIWLLPGEDSASGHNELYMNATYISTGILRSNNWNGVLEYKQKNGQWIYDIKTHPTQGVYFNLNEGKIWAANFELTAGNTLYLNSNPSAGGNWFRVGTSTNYLKFTKDSDSASSLTLNMTGNFTLNAGGVNTADFLGLYSADQSSATTIHGQGLTTWRIIAGKNFGVTKDGSVYASNVDIEGVINSEEGYIGGWEITETTLENGTITLDSSKSLIQGGTLKGANILGGSLDIGGKATAETGGGAGKGAFSVDSSGNIHIGSKGDGDTNYPFEVSNTGSLCANEGTIGGWKVTKTEIKHNTEGGICLTSGATGGISSSNWNSLPNGTTEFKDLQVANTFKVKKALGATPGAAGEDVLVVTSGGDLKFEGDIHLGPGFEYVGYGGTGAGTVSTADAAIADGGGFKTVKIDTPWDNSKGFMTFYNGILVGFRTEASTWDDFVGWLFGKETVDGVSTTKTIGSTTRPVYVKKGVIEPIDRGIVGALYMGQGTAYDPTWITVTGYSDTSYPTRFGLGHAGKISTGDNTGNNCKFYVDVPIFTAATATTNGKVGLVPAPAAGDNSRKFLCGNRSWAEIPAFTAATTTVAGKSGAVPAPAAGDNSRKFLCGSGSWAVLPTFTAATSTAAGKSGAVPAPAAGDTSGKFLQCNGSWTALTAETKATDGYVLAGNGTGTSDTKPSFQSLGSLLGATAANKGSVLASDGANSLTWKSLPTLVSLLPAMAEKAGKVLKVNANANGVYWGDDNNSTNFAPASHSHSGYHSANSPKLEMSESSNSYMYAVVCNKASPNTLYRYASTIGTVASSMRYKKNIQPLTDSSILYLLEPVQFQYKKSHAVNNNIRYGFIAEDVKKFAPELVEMDADDDKLCNALYPDSILALAVAEIQKLRKELDELKSNLNK